MTVRRTRVPLAFSIFPLAAVVAFTAWGPAGAALAQEPVKAGAATVEGVLRKTADFYKKAKSVAVELSRGATGPGQNGNDHDRSFPAAEPAFSPLEIDHAHAHSRSGV